MRARWHPAVALVLDGVGWGSAVGMGLPALDVLVDAVAQRDPDLLRFGLVVVAVGTLVGSAVGLVVGACGAAVMATSRRLGRPPVETALTTIAAALLGPVLLARISGPGASHTVAGLMAVAAGPLAVDVVRLILRPTGSTCAGAPAASGSGPR